MKSKRIDFEEILFDAIVLILGFLKANSTKNPWWFVLFASSVVGSLILKKSGFWDDEPRLHITSLKFWLFSAWVILVVIFSCMLFAL